METHVTFLLLHLMISYFSLFSLFIFTPAQAGGGDRQVEGLAGGAEGCGCEG